MRKCVTPAALMVLLWAIAGLAGNPPATDWQSVLASWSAPDIIQPRAASADYSVIVESKKVHGGDAARIGIYLKNAEPLRSIVIPLVVRSIDAGAFWTSATPAFDHTARINGYLNGIYNGELIWPEITNTWPNIPGRGVTPRPLDYVSPDCILFAKGRILAENNLPAGDDGVPRSGRPSIVIDIIANNVPGRFEIDTTMISPANHLIFILGQETPMVGVRPEFTKGVISILPNDVAIDSEDSLDPGNAPADTIPVIPGTETGGLVSDSTTRRDSSIVPSVDPVEVTRLKDKGHLANSSENAGTESPAAIIKSKGTTVSSPATGGRVTKVAMCSNFPNPFNAGTSIRYAVSDFTTVDVSVYNMLGQKVATIAEGARSPGEYFAIWNATDARGVQVPSGVYFYRVQTGNRAEVGKMTLIR